MDALACIEAHSPGLAFLQFYFT